MEHSNLTKHSVLSSRLDAVGRGVLVNTVSWHRRDDVGRPLPSELSRWLKDPDKRAELLAMAASWSEAQREEFWKPIERYYGHVVFKGIVRYNYYLSELEAHSLKQKVENNTARYVRKLNHHEDFDVYCVEHNELHFFVVYSNPEGRIVTLLPKEPDNSVGAIARISVLNKH